MPMGKRSRVVRKPKPTQSISDYSLFSADTSAGWRIVRLVSFDRGCEKVAAGLWAEVHDDFGNLVGFQVKTAVRGDFDLASMHAPAHITPAEMRLAAGLSGESRTAGKTEDQRQEYMMGAPRGRRQLEDAVERAQAKVRVYPQITGAKQDILRVWPRK